MPLWHPKMLLLLCLLKKFFDKRHNFTQTHRLYKLKKFNVHDSWQLNDSCRFVCLFAVKEVAITNFVINLMWHALCCACQLSQRINIGPLDFLDSCNFDNCLKYTGLLIVIRVCSHFPVPRFLLLQFLYFIKICYYVDFMLLVVLVVQMITIYEGSELCLNF